MSACEHRDPCGECVAAAAIRMEKLKHLRAMVRAAVRRCPGNLSSDALADTITGYLSVEWLFPDVHMPTSIHQPENPA